MRMTVATPTSFGGSSRRYSSRIPNPAPMHDTRMLLVRYTFPSVPLGCVIDLSATIGSTRLLVWHPCGLVDPRVSMPNRAISSPGHRVCEADRLESRAMASTRPGSTPISTRYRLSTRSAPSLVGIRWGAHPKADTANGCRSSRPPHLPDRCPDQRKHAGGSGKPHQPWSCAFNSGLDCISRRQDSSVITVERHPSGIVRPTPADILRSRKIEPTARARPIMPPKELKKTGRSSSFGEARKSRSRCGAPGSNRPSPPRSIRYSQDRTSWARPRQETKIIGCCWMRSRIARAFSRAAASSFPAALVKLKASTAHRGPYCEKRS